MSDAIEKVGQVATAMAVWSPDQKELIKRTCAVGATDDELALFLHVAARAQLDPLRKQIHFIKAGGRFYTVADVNGLQARAAREADFEGITHAVVYEKDEFVVDNVTGQVVKHTNNPLGSNGAIVGAWATVRRKGMLPFTAVVRFNEYRNDGNGQWKVKPAVMIDKCAKSTALRLAYPEQLGGVYDDAELGKEEREVNDAPATAVVAPKNAAEAKAQLAATIAKANAAVPAPAAASQVVDAPKKAGRIVDEGGPTPWERIKAAGLSAQMSPDDITTEALRIAKKTKRVELNAADADAFCKWVEDAQEPPMPDSPPPESLEEAAPF